MKNNLLFETSDIQVDYEPNELDEFLADAKESVKTKTATYTTSNTGYRYGTGNYGGYNYGVNTYSSPKTENKKESAPTVAQQKLADEKSDDKDYYSDKWWNHYYGYYDDVPDDDDEGYLPGYPHYNATVKNGKKKKKHR